MSLDLLLRTAANDARAMVATIDAPPIGAVYRRRRWAALATGALVVLVLAVASLLIRALSAPEPPVVTEVTTTTSPPLGFQLLPDELGTFEDDTALGTWTWTRIDGNEQTLPAGGFFAADGRYYALDGTALWSSDDGLSWRIEPTDFDPTDHYRMWNSDGVWVTAYGPAGTSLYRWDAGDLIPVPVPVSVPEIEHMTWYHNGVSKIVELGDSRFALASSGGSIDWSGIFESPIETWRYEGRTLTLSDWNGELPNLTLAVEVLVADQAIEFSDPETGQVVLRVLTGGTLVHIEQLTGSPNEGLSPTLWSLLADHGTGFEPVIAPWVGLSVDQVDIAVGSGGLLAVGFDQRQWEDPAAGPLLHAWRSVDGVKWEQLTPPALVGDVSRIGLDGDGERMFLVASLADQDPGAAIYTSTDGSIWQRLELDLGLSFVNDIARTSFGWVLTQSRQFEAESKQFWYETWDVWFSADGLIWSRLPRAPDVTSYDGMLSSGGMPAGDVIFIVTGWTDGSRKFWLGRLTG